MTAGERVDIRAPTAAICAALGLKPEDVLEMHWSPGELHAAVLVRNERGKIFMGQDDKIVRRWLTFPVRS